MVNYSLWLNKTAVQARAPTVGEGLVWHVANHYITHYVESFKNNYT